MLEAITKKCTRVADRAFPDGESLGRNRVILVVLRSYVNLHGFKQSAYFSTHGNVAKLMAVRRSNAIHNPRSAIAIKCQRANEMPKTFRAFANFFKPRRIYNFCVVFAVHVQYRVRENAKQFALFSLLNVR